MKSISEELAALPVGSSLVLRGSLIHKISTDTFRVNDKLTLTSLFGACIMIVMDETFGTDMVLSRQ
jgi:hypothetical protein